MYHIYLPLIHCAHFFMCSVLSLPLTSLLVNLQTEVSIAETCFLSIHLNIILPCFYSDPLFITLPH